MKHRMGLSALGLLLAVATTLGCAVSTLHILGPASDEALALDHEGCPCCILKGCVANTYGYAIDFESVDVSLSGPQLKKPIETKTDAAGCFEIMHIPAGKDYTVTIKPREGRSYVVRHLRLDVAMTISLTINVPASDFYGERW